MEFDDKELKLIYVLKIGYNVKDEGCYQFVFSTDETNINVEDWCWDLSPACDHAQPPTEDYIDAVFNLITSSFDLFCLHEAVDREYMHGVHTIHALAFETERMIDDGSNYDKMFEEDENPLLVFHYGMTLAKIKDLLYARKIILKDNDFIETSSVKF